MSRPKLSDVWWMTVTLLPVTRCEPPDGQACWLQQRPTTGATATDAKRHTLENPGHLVVREIVNRTQYHLDPADQPAEAAADG